jgi:hypothetical protein
MFLVTYNKNKTISQIPWLNLEDPYGVSDYSLHLMQRTLKV